MYRSVLEVAFSASQSSGHTTLPDILTLVLQQPTFKGELLSLALEGA
jgi:hypothetical protein